MGSASENWGLCHKTFEKVMINSKRKPERLWVDKGREFYNREFKKLLEKNGILMYRTFNEDKSVVVERFNRTLKNKCGSILPPTIQINIWMVFLQS